MNVKLRIVVVVLALVVLPAAGVALAAPAASNAPAGLMTSATHVVQPGETLATISVLYGVPQSAIEKANQVDASYDLYDGESLTIPLAQQIEPGYTIGRYYGMVNPW